MRDGRILLIQHLEHATGRAYWVLPGGGLEEGETELECVRREVREETHLEVEVERLLLDEPSHVPEDMYKRLRTYLCRAVSGEPRPGYEPEPEAAAEYSIAAVGWWSIDDETTWDAGIADDPITVHMLRRVRSAME
ncbi:NUDIX domain-containing protein [Candidatus Poribacteria bacterium]|jgi:ADP-ribose pyrophosphatase YjhB (NUDIX family)|nr:NUDIX domain-containing protein [Candidatus Poribacteria bacterium]MBT5533254.1 NUDIX domain-containing protein [Candidatus Poribacteria bacterium]MBT7096455.1 NUDIX domain-containing protein [Candidatus Poribacteria bacterium]MBT7807607.1 NUDIX domain-containing protein [Candidatus Poribacteria bacterium]